MTDLVGAGLPAVITALVPYWAAEQEICRTYLSRPDRPAQVEVDWLARQAAKELHDGVEPRLERVRAAVTSGAPAAVIAREAEELHEEAAHLVVFAEAHDAVARSAGLPALADRDLAALAGWPANKALRSVRARHHVEHGPVGDLATTFTEGGCAGLFAVGSTMPTRDDADRAIARACAAVLDDEMEHLATGFQDLTALADRADPSLLEHLVVEQSIARLHMRQSQFAEPVEEARFEELLAGDAAPDEIRDVERRLGGAGSA